MSNPFASIERTINDAVSRALCNATARISGVAVSGVFRDGYAEGISGIASGTSPTFDCLEDDLPTIGTGDTVRIGADPYTIANVHPDGTGWVSLILRRA